MCYFRKNFFYHLGKCNICQKYSRDIVVKASKYNSSLTTKTCRNKICEEFLQMKRNDWKMKQTIKYKPQRDKELVHYQYKSYQCRRCVMISHNNEEKSYKWKRFKSAVCHLLLQLMMIQHFDLD